MRVLGISCGHDSSLAVVEDGKVLFAISEERLTGIKKTWGFPARSLLYAERELGYREFDRVMVADLYYAPYRNESIPASKFPYFKNMTPVEHHKAHAALAYAWSGWDECTVLTCDGGGDDIFATVNRCKDGVITRIGENTTVNEAFGMLYYYVTEMMGFKPNRHEGKVMGLAASGIPRDVFDDLFRVEGTQIISELPRLGAPVIKRLQAISGKINGYDLAASCQKHFSDILTEWVLNNAAYDVAVSGGCFANVLANMRISQEWYDKSGYRYYVTPSMMDDGLAIGAALCGFDKIPVKRQEHMYLGPSEYHLRNMSRHQIAREIYFGKVVGLFQGRMEFGPRALGNRTILADPRDASINQKLNQRLHRTEFMPFAPVILAEYADGILEGYQICADNAPFMTSCWKVKPEWAKKIPAVVHVDGTCRPQVIERETNPFYYDIIKSYYDITGIPVLINTSFNGHEEPIVCFGDEADWALNTGKIDILARN